MPCRSRLRENAESIAFYQGESQEEDEVSTRLGGAVRNKRRILGTQRNLEFFTTAYSYLVQILPVLVVSPLYFAGSVELGVITQARPSLALAPAKLVTSSLAAPSVHSSCAAA